MIIALLVLVGLGIGALSGMLGIGGGVLLVPILVWFFNYDQKEAAGLSLAVLTPPIMLPVVWRYYMEGVIDASDLITAGWLAIGFTVGGLIGVYFLRYVPVPTLRLLFGLLLIYVAVRFLLNSDNDFAAAALGISAVAGAWLAFLGMRTLGRHYRRPPSLAEAIDAARPAGSDYHI